MKIVFESTQAYPIKYDRVTCPECNGQGHIDDITCEECRGTGEVEEMR